MFGPRQKETPVYRRCVLYSLVLGTLLGFATLWTYRSVPQSKARLEVALREALDCPARLDGYQTPLFGPTTVDSLVLEAAPVIEQRNFLRLDGIRLAPDGSVQIETASIVAESRQSDMPHGETRWNHADLLTPMRLYARAVRHPFEASIRKATVEYVRVGLAGSQTRWSLKTRDVHLDSEPGHGIRARAALDTSSLARGGSFELDWSGPMLTVRGHLDGCASLPTWLPLVTDAWRRRWGDFTVEGPFDLELEEARVRNGRVEHLRGELRYYEGKMRTGGTGLSFDRIHGAIAITEDAVEWGATQPFRARLWGAAVRLDGRVDSKKAELRVQILPQQLTHWGASHEGENGALIDALRFLDLNGVLEGEIYLPLSDDGSAKTRALFRFRDVSSGSLGLFAGAQGEWKWHDRERDRHVTDEAPRGVVSPSKGKIQLTAVTILRVGTMSGEVNYSHAQGVLAIEFEDLRLGAPGEVPQSVDHGTKSLRPTPQVASLSGKMTFRPQGNDRGESRATGGLGPAENAGPTAPGLSLQLRWTGLQLASQLLAAEDFSGTLEKQPGHAVGHGEFELRKVKLAAVELGAQSATPQGSGSLEFPHGRGALDLVGDELRIAHLVLSSGETLLRLRGELQLDGEIHLVCVLTDGENYAFRDQALDTAELAQWKRVAQGEHFRAYRITGTVSEPEVRALSPRDPAFVVAGD